VIEVVIDEIHEVQGQTVAVFSHPKWLVCRNPKGACMVLDVLEDDSTVAPILVQIESKSSNPIFPGRQCAIVPTDRYRVGMKLRFLNDSAPLRVFEEE
jgi:hypothetical protein